MKDMNFGKKTYSVSLSAMFTALSLIFLYLAVIVPAGNLIFYFVSSLFVSGMVVEHKPFYALLVYIASSLLGLLIVPNLLMVLPYVMLFGHYGIGKYIFEKYLSKTLSYIMKLLYYNVGIVLIYLFAYSVFFEGLLAQIPLLALIAIAQVVFVVFDFVYSKVLLWYYLNVRRRIVR